MKHVAIVVFVILTLTGCDPTRNLDWEKAAKDQPIRIGNRVKVEGLVYGLPIYDFKETDNPGNLWFKKTWGTTLDLWTYNPNNPINDINPNAPIGTVICTIHNPMHNETLKALRKTYPDKIKVSEFPNVKHKFEVIGRIHSFQRAIAHDADTTKPDISLTAVRINVESLTLKE